MKTILTMLLLALTSTAAAQDTRKFEFIGVESGALMHCGQESKGTLQYAMCHAFVNGASVPITLALSLCTPKNVTTQQLGLIAYNWAKANPAKWHALASIGFAEAMMQAFQCPKQKTTPKPKQGLSV